MDVPVHECAARAVMAGAGRMRVLVCGRAGYIGSHMAKWVAPRRAGDPAVLVAASTKARRELGWRPQYTELPPIIESAWRWHGDPRF